MTLRYFLTLYGNLLPGRSKVREALAREESDPYVWCENVRHQMRLTKRNELHAARKPCPSCRADGMHRRE